jgi:hypothetical protein
VATALAALLIAVMLALVRKVLAMLGVLPLTKIRAMLLSP